MKQRSIFAAALAIAMALAACTVGTPATPTLAPTASATLAPTPTATAVSAPTASPTVPPITLPTPGGTGARPCPSDSAGKPAVPPAAQLTGAGGVAVEGSLGSYTFCGTSADALPPKSATLTAVPLGAPATVSIQMVGGWGITGYRAGYWAASEWQGDEVALGNATYAEPVIATTFDGPPNGDWMLAVHVAFPANGDATYYWHVAVP
jgi:hypothetical protein